MKLSHLICKATFLPQAVDLRDPSKRSFLNKSDIIFTEMTCQPIALSSGSQSNAEKQDNPAAHRFSQD